MRGGEYRGSAVRQRLAVVPAEASGRRAVGTDEYGDDCRLNGTVRMGSQVRYCDDKTGEVRDVVLVYPHEADITLRRISVLTPVGAALIGLSVGQTIEFNTPGHQTRSLTILGVSN